LALVSKYTTDIALQVEKRLHNIYQDFRESGEWFQLPQRVIDTFTEICADVESQLVSNNAKFLKSEIDRLNKENADLKKKASSLNSIKTQRDFFAAKCLDLNSRLQEFKESYSSLLDHRAEEAIRNSYLRRVSDFVVDCAAVGRMVEYVDSIKEDNVDISKEIKKRDMVLNICEEIEHLIFIAENCHVKNALLLLGMSEDDFLSMPETLDYWQSRAGVAGCIPGMEMSA
jgi:hypothetical protein